MTISDFLLATTSRLGQAGIKTARLDAQIIAAHATHHTRAWILAHDDEALDTMAQARLEKLVSARASHTPLAYILGEKEFYGRQFLVTPDVLIPRPETEEIVEQLSLLRPLSGDSLLDVGTGSGAIAITAALTWSGITVAATDISQAALTIAEQNAIRHNARITFFESDLLENVPSVPFRFITANLPYVDPTWARSPETDAEPALALFAPDSGLGLIKKLITQAPHVLAPQGYLLLEADPRQHATIVESASEFLPVAAREFIIVLQRR